MKIKWLAFSLAFLPLQALCDSNNTDFLQGNKLLSINSGIGRSLDTEYLVFGLGFGYYVADGLELGLDFDLWLGNNPLIYKVEPEVRYVFRQLDTFVPYLGVFYQQNFIEGMDSRGALGFRAGLYTPIGDNFILGYGASFSSLGDCDENIYGSCSSEQIELTFSFKH